MIRTGLGQVRLVSKFVSLSFLISKDPSLDIEMGDKILRHIFILKVIQSCFYLSQITFNSFFSYFVSFLK